MSKKQDNLGRAAKACSDATGVGYNRCWEWARDGRITRRLSVPDASSPAQRQFEALIAHTLTEPLRDSQLDGAVLGIQGLYPDGERPTLHVHPLMANHIVAEMLPRFDADYGGLRGVPGLRLDRVDGDWLFVDVNSSTASVRLAHDDPAWRPSLPAREAGLTRIWQKAPTRLSSIERRELTEWSWEDRAWPRPDARDLLFSRLLRRPLLVNAAGGSHGWANTYTHHTHDIVLEWCCGAPALDLAVALRRSGMTAEAEDVDIRPEGDLEPHTERIDMGAASIVLRCLDASWCRGERGARSTQKIADAIRRRYQ